MKNYLFLLMTLFVLAACGETNVPTTVSKQTTQTVKGAVDETIEMTVKSTNAVASSASDVATGVGETVKGLFTTDTTTVTQETSEVTERDEESTLSLVGQDKSGQNGLYKCSVDKNYYVGNKPSTVMKTDLQTALDMGFVLF